MLKKFLSLLLSISIIVSAVVIGVYAQDDEGELNFAVASDLHYEAPRAELEGEINDPIYWYANRRAAMEDESSFIIDEFLNQCAENDKCDYVLISGDLVNSGRSYPDYHKAVAAKLKAFEEKTGKDVFVINGNHDLAEDSATTRAMFKEIYADFGYDKALVKDEETCSYTANLGEKYRLIALDSNHATKSTEDGMTAERIQWVCEQAKQAKKDGRYPILMMHHNLLDHMPLQRIVSRNFIVKFHYTTAEIFADCGIKLVLTGHEHCSDATSYTSALGNKIYDFVTTSLTMYPLSYRQFNLDENEINYSEKTIDSIDTDALSSAVKGYSQEQLALMNENLDSYAKGFLKAGVRYRLERSLSMEKMGIAEDEFYYDIVKTAVDSLKDILEMPFYGENSLQELAKEYSIDLPETDYKNGWDLATDLVAAHYEGEEDKTLDSAAVTSLLKTATLILRKVPADVCDETIFGAANKVLESFGMGSITAELTKYTSSVFGAVTPCEYLIVAIAAPFLYEFAYDSDSVNDNNGTLPGYGTSSVGGNIDNVKENLNSITDKIALYVKLAINYIFKIFDFLK